MNNLTLFIFRRDLRIEDNIGLINSLKTSKKVIPIFIFTDEQLKYNKYKSENAKQFMIKSLKELEKEFKNKNKKLYLFQGDQYKIINKLIIELKIDCIAFNKDYTNYSKNRDNKIIKIANNNNIKTNISEDYCLNKLNKVLKKDLKPYTVFTPYYKKAMDYPVNKPIKNNHNNYYNKVINNTIEIKSIKVKNNNNIKVNGGRNNALKIIRNIKKFKNYSNERDIPHLDNTTKLSAHIKFGTISIREVYWNIKINLDETHPLIRQLYWHDFFAQISYNFPQIYNSAFKEEYNQIKWDNNKNKFEKWKKGLTGFPIVDAGMRELNKTGYMHNRVRMITASFLVKDLQINWQLGEKYFATKLVDYDPSLNNGNWQWAASTGCDAQPYFRIFNPWLQQKKFDSNCTYIKKWIPELKDISPKEIHNLEKQQSLRIINTNYPNPIVEHKKERIKILNKFKEIKIKK